MTTNKNKFYDLEDSVKTFFKYNKEKNNLHYVILNSSPLSYIDIRTLALKTNNLDEKLKSFKENIPNTDAQREEDKVLFLIETGSKVILTNDGLFDYFDALNFFLNEEVQILNKKIENYEKKKIFAIDETDSIANAKKIFIEKKISLLPIINDIEVIGEIRLCDLLIQDLYEVEKEGLYKKQLEGNTLDLNAFEIGNKRPLFVKYNQTIKEVIELMTKKKLNSVIVLKEGKLFSILSYKDIFKIYTESKKEKQYEIEYLGIKDLYEDEEELIKQYCEKTMEKIMTVSPYETLKVDLKIIGKDSGHQKKFEIKLLLSHGNKVISLKDEISPGVNDELENNREKKTWNVVELTQNLLKILEQKVINEK